VSTIPSATSATPTTAPTEIMGSRCPPRRARATANPVAGALGVRRRAYARLLSSGHDPAAKLCQAVGVRFTPGWRKAILTLHVVTAVGWLGTDLVLLTLGVAGLSGAADRAVVYPAMALVGKALFVPLSFLVWVVGVVNALGTPWGLVKWWWVATKLGIVTVMLGLVVFALYPNLTAAADAATLAQQQRLNLVIAPAVSSSLLLFSTVLSTYKPWGRTSRGKQRRAAEQGDDGTRGERLREQAGQRGQ